MDKMFTYFRIIEDILYELHDAKEKGDHEEIKELSRRLQRVSIQLKEVVSRDL